MADDRMAATGILQHLGADTAGEGALRLGMAILSAQRNIAAGERLADRGEQCRRRADQELAAMRLPGPRQRHSRASARAVGAQPVHLPVAGDKPFSLSHF